MSHRIERLIAGDFFPTWKGQSPAAYEQAVADHAARLKWRGVTHVMVNQAMVCIPQAMEPENPYFGFCAFGHSLDKFVSSSFSAGIFFEGLMAENRRMLLQQAALAKQHGFRCAIRCVEPTFMMEKFFQRHPALRGPRVDNPACSTMPVYALCPMLPEVQDHYRQLIRKFLQLVPEMDEMHLFTNDSGAGVCHSKHLYAGPNGPYHCRSISAGKQAQVLTRVLAEEGRKLNPIFRVVMTSGLSPKEKLDFVKGIPEGVASSVAGAFAWGGGLEDRWGTQEIGPAVYGNPAERKKVRDWQVADYEARVRQIKENGGIVYANYNSDYYAGDDPRPYETHGIICQLLDWGVTDIIGGAPGSTFYSANTAVFRDALEHGRRPTDEVVAEIARGWVGDAMAPALCEAWKLNDQAAREQPLPPGGHLLQIWAATKHMPIVPDDDRLVESDLDYFRDDMQTYDQKMKEQKGGVWRILNNGPQLKLAYLRQFETATFPALTKAIGMLDGLLTKPGLTDSQRACLKDQKQAVAGVLAMHRHHYHWIAASLHRIQGETAPAGVPSLREIIEREIALVEAAERDAGRDPALHPRVRLMKAHIDDPVKRVDLSEFPISTHAGLKGWEGAHQVE